MRWPEIVIMLIVAMLTIGTAFWIWMLLDCTMNKGLRERSKVIWMICILFTHWVGALIYFCTGRLLRYRLNEVEEQAYAQPRTSHQAYQRGYRSTASSSPSFDQGKISPANSRHKRPGKAHSSDQYEQPQASYPTKQQ